MMMFKKKKDEFQNKNEKEFPNIIIFEKNQMDPNKDDQMKLQNDKRKLKRGGSSIIQMNLTENDLESKAKTKIAKVKRNSACHFIESESNFQEFQKSYYKRKAKKEANLYLPITANFRSKIPGCKNNESDELVLLYEKGMAYLDKTLNYIKIFRLMQDVDKLKLLLLTKEQVSLFNYTSKPILSLNPSIHNLSEALEDISDEYKSIHEIFYYFERIVKSKNPITELDKKLISFLDYDLQEELAIYFSVPDLIRELKSKKVEE